MSSAALLTLALAVTSVAAQVQGFNYGNTLNGAPKTSDQFKTSFTNAQALAGTNGKFSSARLYTMRQGESTDPISALQAASDTKTSLLLGMWCSGDGFDQELQALKNAMQAYPDLKDLIVGLSVGSEDLYRVTPTGIANKAGVGADAKTILSYVNQVKDAVSAGSWKGIKIGHVDTWNAFADNPDQDVPSLITALDFLGVDEYPYYQETSPIPNNIENAKQIFDEAYNNVTKASQGKEIWVTETGWPITGKSYGASESSVDNAQTYYYQVGCPLFGKTNTWWYTLDDGVDANGLDFGLRAADGKTVYNLDCSKAPAVKSTSTTSAVSSASSSASTSSPTGGNSTSSGSTTNSGSTDTSGSGSGNSTSAGSGSASSSAGSGSSSSGSGTGSTGTGTGTGTGSEGSSSSGSASPVPQGGAASTIGSSAIGIFAAVAAAVLLL